MARWGRRILYVVGGLAGLLAVGAAGLYASSSSKISRKYDVAVEEITVPTDSASIVRGEHIVKAIGKCAECHGADLGGQVFIDDPALGRISATNLTRGGVGATYSDAEMARAIRHGVKKDGTGARIMPSEDFQYMSDEDVGAVIAYIRSMPPVDRTLPPFELHALGTALVGAGQLPLVKAEQIDHARKHPATMIADSTVQYGEYLANIGGCTGCHGPGLSGGKIPGTPPEFPPAANLTPTGISHYSDADVETILRTGKRPDGSAVSDFMPWRATTLMTPVEMRATIKYLRTVAPKEYGHR